MSKIEELIQEVKTELGAEFIATDVVGTDGLSIAGFSARPDFNASEAAARLAMVMKLASKVTGKTDMGSVEDTLTTTDEVFIITRYLGDHSYYWSLAVTNEATLGMVRLVMREYADKLWDAIPH